MSDMGHLEFHLLSVKEGAETIAEAIEAHGSDMSSLFASPEVLAQGGGN